MPSAAAAVIVIVCLLLVPVSHCSTLEAGSESKTSQMGSGNDNDKITGLSTCEDGGTAVPQDGMAQMNLRSHEEQQIVRRLLANYKPNIRPNGRNVSKAQKDGGPVMVFTTMRLNFVNNINDANMDFGTQFNFVQVWVDKRLSFHHEQTAIKQLNLASDQKIWIPDTFFQNEKNGHYHMIDSPNEFIKIRSDGLVTYNRRLSITFSCTMELRRFPHDTQLCQMDFASYAYTTNDILYIWNEPAIELVEDEQLLPKFTITSISNASCTSKTTTGEYSCLRVELTFKRLFSFYLLQLYVPSVLLVSVSCVSYWIDWKAAPARVPLSIVTLLTMVTQSHSINATLPPVSYTKAIDLWIGACIVFIFCSLLEYAIVNYTGLLDEKRSRKNKVVESHGPLSHHQSFVGLLSHQQFNSSRRSTATRAASGDSNSHGDYVGHKMADPDTDSRRGSPTITFHGHGYKRASVIDFSSSESTALRQLRRASGVATAFEPRRRAERIDTLSRAFFPTCFLCFNVVYWSIYWT